MGYLYWLDQLRPQDLPETGNKAFNLGRLRQADCPVPAGFVVSALAYQEVVGALPWPESLLADQVLSPGRPLQEAARHMRQLIETEASLPGALTDPFQAACAQLQSPVLILRPSLGHSMALPHGLLAAQFVTTHPQDATKGWREESLMALRRVWASLFSARSLFYWQHQGIALRELSLAVLVQPMVPALASGWCDSPVGLRTNGAEPPADLWAVSGLGVALSRGEAIPDRYRFDSGTSTASWQPGLQARRYTLATEWAGSHKAEQPLRSELLDLSPIRLEPQVLEDLGYWSRQATAQLRLNNGSVLRLEWALTPGKAIVLLQADPQPASLIAERPYPPPFVDAAANLLRGIGVVRGRVQGPARILKPGSTDDTPPLRTQLEPGEILVTASVPPAWLPLIRHCYGLVVEEPGLTSHGAILARELGIPTVIGVSRATELLRGGEVLLLDGSAGTVRSLRAADSNAANHLAASAASAPAAPPPTGTGLFLNLSQSRLAAQMAHLPSSGVGLLRSELLILEILNGQHPYRWLVPERHADLVARLVAGIQPFLAAFEPRPVFYRSLDLRSHEFRELIGGAEYEVLELNPVLGWRGTARYRDQPSLFSLELQALRQLQQSGYQQLRLVLPFVRSVGEFEFARSLVVQAGLFDSPNFQLWMMAEVPAVLFTLPEFVQAGVQGIAIGSDDLTQLLLGVDRDQARLAHLFNANDPAVRSALRQLVEGARQLGLPCSLCGSVTVRYPGLLLDMVRWGITAVSVEPAYLSTAHWALAQAEQQLLLEAARQQRR